MDSMGLSAETCIARRDYAAREATLWSAWLTERSVTNRHALVEHYAAWTRLVARDIFLKIRIHGTEWTDYVHYATIGLLECIDRFDSAKGVYFQTYARHRMRGAILNNIGRFAEGTGRENGPAARYAERIESLNYHDLDSDNALQDVLEISTGLAIGYLLDLGTLPEKDSTENDPYRQLESEHIEQSIAKFVELLPEKERIIIHYHYFQQVSFVEIAGLLELTKGRVSQLHKQAINCIRERLENQESFLKNL